MTFSVNTGTTNTAESSDGTLINDTENQILATEDDSITTDTGLEASHTTSESSIVDDINVVASAWNAAGEKEVQVNASNINVTTTDFVNVDLNLQGSIADITVDVNNAKRGEITTGNGSDIVDVSVLSNGSGWSNKFVVDTGEGDDAITFTNMQNSQFTQLDINAGSGDDVIDISGLNANTSDVSRILNGGSGDDTITGSNGIETIFGGSGNDTIDGGAGADTIYAGSGDDIVAFDSEDLIVSGGRGDDALTVAGTADITGTTGFEVVIGSAGDDVVTLNITDGLIVNLGGDAGDAVVYDSSITFTTSTEAFDLDWNDYATEHGYDFTGLQAYESNLGDIVWSDVDLV